MGAIAARRIERLNAFFLCRPAGHPGQPGGGALLPPDQHGLRRLGDGQPADQRHRQRAADGHPDHGHVQPGRAPLRAHHHAAAARAGAPQPAPAAPAADRGPGDLPPLDHRRQPGRARRRTDRRQLPARPGGRLLPRRGQAAPPLLLRREPAGRRQRPRPAEPGGERPGPDRPRHHGHRAGPAVRATARGAALHPRAPRHPPGRLLLPQGGQGGRLRAGGRVPLPLPRSPSAQQGDGPGDAGGHRRGQRPGGLQPLELAAWRSWWSGRSTSASWRASWTRAT